MTHQTSHIKTLTQNKAGITTLLEKHEHIYLTTHRNPDDDAIGSVLALYLYLIKSYPHKKIQVFIEGKSTTQWDYLANASEITFTEDLSSINFAPSLLIFLDGNTTSRFTNVPINLILGDTICIDHHSGQADSFTATYFDNTATCTAELLVRLFFVNDNTLNKDICECLLMAIMGDTGSFRWVTSKNAGILSITERLLKFSQLDIRYFNRKLSEISVERCQIIRVLLNNLQFHTFSDGQKLAYSFLTKQEQQTYSLSEIKRGYHQFIYLFLQSIEGYHWGFTAIPISKGTWKLAFRSAPGYPDVQKITSQYFSGGGHPAASGGLINLHKSEQSLKAEDVCQMILSTLEQADLPLVPE